MAQFPKVGIVYLSYHSEPYFERAFKAILASNYSRDRLELIIIDNPHSEFGSSVNFIKSTVEGYNTPATVLPLNGGGGERGHAASLTLSPVRGEIQRGVLPRVTILPQEKNLGFAGGNNVGIKKVLELGCEYVYLHNQDGFVEPRTIQKLVEVMESDKTVGAAQSLIMLYPETDLVNTTGNAFHYLGFGYSGGLRQTVSQLSFRPKRSEVEKSLDPCAATVKGSLDSASAPLGMTKPKTLEIIEIGYASGASLMMRSDLLKKYGALDEDLFLYHEDLEYSLRLKSVGYCIVAVPESVFYHQYSFSRNKDKYYLMERNRFAVILMYYKLPTIILLLPIAVVVELGLISVSLAQGWSREKFRVYGYWLRPSSWSLWFAKRVHWQHTRTVSDKQLLQGAVSTIKFDDDAINNPVLRYFANPVMTAYWFLVKKLIVW